MTQIIDYFEEIRGFVSPHIWSRGRSYYRQGAVLDIRKADGTIMADVVGSKRRVYTVTIAEDGMGIEDMDCTCPYFRDWGEVCKHIVAVLLHWKERVKNNKSSPFPRDLYRTATYDTPFSSPPSYINQPSIFSLHPFFNNWFSIDEGMDVIVDLIGDNRPQLEINMTSKKSGRMARLIAPPEDVPTLLDSLQGRTDIKWTDRAKDIRKYKTPIIPYIFADYDEKGKLVLNPVYKGNNGGLTFTAEEVMRSQVGNWFFTGSGYRPIQDLPSPFKPYFNREKPLIYEGDEIPSFIRDDLKDLIAEIRFRPSSTVRSSQILTPSLRCISVESDERDWFWIDPIYEAGNLRVALKEILSLQVKNGYVRRGNVWLKVPEEAENYKIMGGEIQEGKIRLPKMSYIRARVEWDKSIKVDRDRDVERFECKIDRIEPSIPGPELRGYKGTLRPYQKDGYNWLWFLYKNGLNGILADEMGLGKTHQTMAILLSVYNNGTYKPSLIVCPTSVLDHWEDKLAEYAPQLKVVRYHGLKRRDLLSDIYTTIVLTTYSILSRDVELLKEIEWEYVVLDEAQKIKNFKTEMFRASKLLKANQRLALTGTPIENRLSELWSIFDFLNPGYLWSNKEFRERFEIPIMKYSSKRAEAILKRIIHPFKLRRLKVDVLNDLPPKVEDTRHCELTPHQVVLYKAIVAEEGSNLIADLRDSGKRINYIHIFSVLSKLKRICDHPLLVLDDGRKRGNLTSGKFELFKELLDEVIESGEKVVVFSQYLEMMDIIEGWLKKKGIGYSSLRGSTRDRREVINYFQNNPDCRVFVGSLMAGGLGIDLTAASVVIHYDRWWNAARENQATDRIHRIGQKKGVQVFKLITRGTLEEKIDRMIMKKAALMDTIIENDPSGLKAMTRNEFIELLTFGR